MPYLYAVVGSAPLPELPDGAFGEPLSLLDAGSVRAVVGDLKDAPEVSKERLAGHDRVVRALASFGPVLPARFGQLDGETALHAALLSREQAFARALELVKGCVQMTVRLKLQPRANGTEAGDGAATKRSGRAYLEAQRARRSPPELEALRRALSSCVRAEKTQLTGEPPTLASLYHLVPSVDLGAWQRALTAAHEASGARLQVTGPWPPYAFVPELA